MKVKKVRFGKLQCLQIGRADVEKLVDTAIANSHKLGRKLSGLFSSNKNDDGLYILIESDFIF